MQLLALTTSIYNWEKWLSMSEMDNKKLQWDIRQGDLSFYGSWKGGETADTDLISNFADLVKPFINFFVRTRILPSPWPRHWWKGTALDMWDMWLYKYRCICNEINIYPIVISDFKSYQLTIQDRATLILQLKSTNEINIIYISLHPALYVQVSL